METCYRPFQNVYKLKFTDRLGTMQPLECDSDDLLGLRIPWKCRVFLMICGGPVWAASVATVPDAQFVDYDDARSAVMTHLNASMPWWSLYKVQSMATLVEASMGPWTYRLRTMRTAARAIQDAQRKLDFRPIVVRVPPLDALEFKVCLEACMPAACTIVSARCSAEVEKAIARPPDEPWYRALPFFSKLFEDQE